MPQTSRLPDQWGTHGEEQCDEEDGRKEAASILLYPADQTKGDVVFITLVLWGEKGQEWALTGSGHLLTGNKLKVNKTFGISLIVTKMGRFGEKIIVSFQLAN